MPDDPEAAAVLRIWSAANDETTLDASQLNLSRADLSGTDLALATFFDTNLAGARLAGADLYCAQSADATLDNADLIEASLVKADLRETSLRGADLSRANLGSADLWKVDARSASFRQATLDGASLIVVQFQGTDLTGVSAQNTTFQVVIDGDTVVTGLFGTLHGRVHLSESGSLRELAGLELELWLNSRGASVQVVNSPRGTTTYYARITDEFPRSHPAGVVRRRRAGLSFRDEAFTRNLRWEPTEYLRLYELGHNEDEHVEITEAEANAFVQQITAKLGGGADV